MAAQTKSDLIGITAKEFAKLAKLIDGIDTPAAMRRGHDDTSIKDVVAHRAHWITLFIGWYTDGLAGKPVHFPAEGYKWNDLRSVSLTKSRRARSAFGVFRGPCGIRPLISLSSRPTGKRGYVSGFDAVICMGAAFPM